MNEWPVESGAWNGVIRVWRAPLELFLLILATETVIVGCICMWGPQRRSNYLKCGQLFPNGVYEQTSGAWAPQHVECREFWGVVERNVDRARRRLPWSTQKRRPAVERRLVMKKAVYNKGLPMTN